MVAPVWTPDMDAELLRLRGEGLQYDQVGAAMGVSRKAAIGRANRLKKKGVNVPSVERIKKVAPVKDTRRHPVPKIKTAAANRGPGTWSPRGDGPKDAWRIVSEKAWMPLPGSSPIPLVGRPSCRCAWPVGPDGADQLACGEVSQPGRAYCDAHHRMAWIKPSRPFKEFQRHALRMAERC